jgi:class 3 adenylate cyclase
MTGKRLCLAVMALSSPREVLLSRVVTDLVAGAGLKFSERGVARAEGAPGPLRPIRRKQLVARETDAERAARAALSIQRGLAELNHKNGLAGKPSLNARIGIEAGPVVVDAVGEIYSDA